MAACIAGSEVLTRLILQEDPTLCSKPFVGKSTFPVVSMLLGCTPKAVNDCCPIGLFLIRKALDEDDTELLAAMLKQQICKHIWTAIKTVLEERVLLWICRDFREGRNAF